MRGLATLSVLSVLTACADKDTRSPSSGSATASAAAQGSTSAAGSVAAPAAPSSAASGSAAPGSAAPGSAASGSPTDVGSAAPTPSSTASDGADEVARLVVRDVGSKALGNQKIEASCVSVVVMPAGTWTVAAAWLKGCGDKTARSILWLYKRQGNTKWSEDYVGQPPSCWKGVPPDIAEAVTKATKIPSC